MPPPLSRENTMKATFAALVAGMIGCPCVLFVSGACADPYKETILYSFCSQTNCADGAAPFGTLIDHNGMLYGTTDSGGTSCDAGCGTVFTIDPDTGAEKVLYSFCRQSNCADGAGPEAGLIDLKGTLYGTTIAGGASDDGTVFSVDPRTHSEKVLHSFCSLESCTDGAYPRAGLIAVNDKLYGTTEGGGNPGCSNGCGTVFSLDPRTGAETVLYSFCLRNNCPDGEYPLGGLIDVKGTLYGTTALGGTGCDGGCGTVFSLDPKTGTEAVLYNFCSLEGCTDGDEPYAGLMEMNGMLYSTTFIGGAYDGGTAFVLDPNTGAETVLHSFGDSDTNDGSNPYVGLIALKGILYGTTVYGGAIGSKFCGIGCGTAFSIDPNTGTETVLHSFGGGAAGGNPLAGLISVNGKLYGTGSAGGGSGCGGSGCGVVFMLTKKR